MASARPPVGGCGALEHPAHGRCEGGGAHHLRVQQALRSSAASRAGVGVALGVQPQLGRRRPPLPVLAQRADGEEARLLGGVHRRARMPLAGKYPRGHLQQPLACLSLAPGPGEPPAWGSLRLRFHSDERGRHIRMRAGSQSSWTGDRPADHSRAGRLAGWQVIGVSSTAQAAAPSPPQDGHHASQQQTPQNPKQDGERASHHPHHLQPQSPIRFGAVRPSGPR